MDCILRDNVLPASSTGLNRSPHLVQLRIAVQLRLGQPVLGTAPNAFRMDDGTPRYRGIHRRVQLRDRQRTTTTKDPNRQEDRLHGDHLRLMRQGLQATTMHARLQQRPSKNGKRLPILQQKTRNNHQRNTSQRTSEGRRDASKSITRQNPRRTLHIDGKPDPLSAITQDKR
jgi:hypothetical protein